MTTNHQHEAKIARIKWACRRGMLELDLILKAFLDSDFKTLTPDEHDKLLAYLENPDPDLYAWLMGYQSPTKPLDIEYTAKIIKSTNTKLAQR
jgi:antitoxin CptB